MSRSGTIRHLGVLDQSPIPEGLNASDALQNSVDLARAAEAAGYHRYWVAEHHGTPGLACHSPEVLISAIGAATHTIRIGSGGVMLPHYSPLKVAENFGMLEGLYPGRIDLGIGRAAGTSRNVSLALQRDRRQPAPDDFPEQLAELREYFGEGRAETGPLRQIHSNVLRFPRPDLWLLGSSPQSAIWAAELGLPYAFADFINPQGSAMAAHYLANFQPTSERPEPRLAVAVWAICAETNEEAYDLSLSSRMMLAFLHQGRLIPVPSPQKARQFAENSGGALELLTASRRFITGDPSRVRAQIEAVAQEYGASEVLVVNILHDHSARRRSYELLAEEFGLRSSNLESVPALA
jgi:luciferase family oxidoreductase group 1